jgi:hypothetical protein
MGQALDTLLSALARTPGDTCEVKMEKLIADGAIFTPNLGSMQTIARRMDSATVGVFAWLEKAGLDIEANELSKRLCNIHMDVSPQKVRENPEFYSSAYVTSLEDIYRRGQEMRIPRRKLRFVRP